MLCSAALGAAGCSSSSNGAQTGDAGATGGAGGTVGGGGASGSAGTAGSGAAAGAGGAAGSAGNNGDQYGPWAGGAAYYKKFSHGPPSDPSFFPITVWLQSPSSAKAYEAIGINTYVGLYKGPTDTMLSNLAAANMPVACDQNAVGLANLSDPTIVEWTQQDEPDNAQPASGGGYGPCVPASTIQGLYQQMRTNDPTRPVFLNLGQGVANDPYVGWGSACSKTHPGDYPDYIKGSDVISFDIYPSNSTDPNVQGKLWLVAKGVDNLMTWSGGKKPVWNWIECTGIDDPSGKPTPTEVKAEVWMSIVHGSMGIGYFVHEFKPTFDEHALLDDATMKAAVAAINQQIHDLAPVLNTPPIINGGSVASSAQGVPVDMLLKRQGGATYIFAVDMRGTATHATFSGLTNIPAGAQAEVIGENRQIPITGAAFQDDFSPWAVHLYKIQ